MVEKFLGQSPLIAIVFTSLITFIILMQSLTKHKFLIVRFLISVLLIFFSVLILVFFDDLVDETNKRIYIVLTYIALASIDVISFILLFTVVDLSFSNQSFQQELKKSLDETKFFVLLNKRDKIKEISSFFLKDLGIEEKTAIGKNFFDVIELKYYIVSMNGQPCLKDDIKKFYKQFNKKIDESKKNTSLEIEIKDDFARKDALYFNESDIFTNGKYRGRILLGERKSEEDLIGLEKKKAEAQNELQIIKERFITLLQKTTDGIFFNTLNTGTLWVNDVIVRRLFLNGNAISIEDFFRNIHPDDLRSYQEKIKDFSGNEYEASYRFNVGNYYVYVKEEGKRITQGETIELCGVMTIVDEYSYEKTGTVLDQIGTEATMLNKLRQLYQEDRMYQLVKFKVTSIPEINEKYGRAIGNACLNQYVSSFKQSFVDGGLLYRVGGLDFVAILINYQSMEALKNSLKNGEKVLHTSLNYGDTRIKVDVNMGICMSNEAPNPQDVLKFTNDALVYSLNPQYQGSYIYYKDISYGRR